MSVLIDKAGPYAHAPTSVQRVMVLVIAALMPATLFNIWLFGWPALFLFLVTLGSCLAVEALCLRMSGRSVQPTLFDGSALLTGWLLAMSLPPWAPWWIGVAGGITAIVFGKHVFGGLGQNAFNPAMVARVALLISFPVQMTAFTPPKALFGADSPGLLESLRITFAGGLNLDTMTAASPLGYVKTELSRGIPLTDSMAKVPDMMDLALGTIPGSFGETSAALILLGGLFLIAKRVITWHIPVAVMGTVFVLGFAFNAVDPARYAPGLFHLLSGATLLGAFFIATDYVTSPVSKQGQLVYGIGVGLLTWIIRTYAGYPEGMAFAVLLMNAMTPLIDRQFRPRVFGRTRKGEPLAVKEGK